MDGVMVFIKHKIVFVFRNKPADHTLEEFEKTCEMCGEFFGYDTTYDCMTDRSKKIFRLCLTAVGKK